ncbi:MAG: Adenine deaminase [Candidatus Celerinatantimonas neptuna]|nr:MAG: Adenine deaminase [Candidatus Celerinatantimonas neptuna]
MITRDFVEKLPKVELHLHIEGTLEPELMFELAHRNQLPIVYKSPEDVKQAYQFNNLQSFLDIYYQGADVLRYEQDFYDLTWAYLKRCQADHVIHTEIFFDPQTHTHRGISFDTVVNGINRALKDGQQELGISSQLIMCFLRHLDEENAFLTLEQALPYRDKIVGVGLDSSEVGHPPEKFAKVFAKALELGFKTVAHAGEEGSANNIKTSIETLGVSRIDHGVRCVDDPELVEELAKNQMPLTVCPLSNLKLKVFDKMSDHNIVTLLDKGLCVTINSDDPAYFGGYMTENFWAVICAHSLSKKQVAQFTVNAINASFISSEQKAVFQKQLKDYVISSGEISSML